MFEKPFKSFPVLSSIYDQAVEVESTWVSTRWSWTLAPTGWNHKNGYFEDLGIFGILGYLIHLKFWWGISKVRGEIDSELWIWLWMFLIYCRQQIREEFSKCSDIDSHIISIFMTTILYQNQYYKLSSMYFPSPFTGPMENFDTPVS